MEQDNPDAKPIYSFGACCVDVARREISVADTQVTIEPKAFDLLVYLIEHRERAVGKQELQDNIWPGVIVTEAALTRCVMKARRAVADASAANEAIKTIHGHGYRFVAPLSQVASTSDGRSTGKFGQPSVAVMPFANLSNDQEQEYFSDGITEDIIVELSRFRSLVVIARHSSFTFKGESTIASQIGAQLGVVYLVFGSVRKAGERIRISVRLLDAESGNQLWAERYDRELSDVLIIQDEVAVTVAATISGRVEASRGRKQVGEEAFEAYDHTLRAQALYYKVNKSDNAKARLHLEKALQSDSQNARAMGLLAAVHSIDSWSFWSLDSDKSQELSLEYGRRSIELDDTDSLVHGLYGEILFDCGEYELAESHFHRAIALNHNDIAARALFASKLAALGRIDEALAHLAVCEQRDPFGLVWLPWIKATVMLGARRYDEAIAAFNLMPNPPNTARLEHVSALLQAGKQDEAKTVLARFLHVARQEMPAFPGGRFEDWEPLLPRFIDFQNPQDRESFAGALQTAWPSASVSE